ncbi:hypothetical protein F4809DRAFT_643258 [Biscogniauxia mediterranea]|nr:hypothetical protein F4809DRAFT_643258 [Biscogniauxia mediterranea]
MAVGAAAFLLTGVRSKPSHPRHNYTPRATIPGIVECTHSLRNPSDEHLQYNAMQQPVTTSLQPRGLGKPLDST